MYKKNKTYELEVQFGILVLIVIMLCLNIVSNYALHNAKNLQKINMIDNMYLSSLAVSRYLQNNHLTTLSETQKQEFLLKYKLNELLYISTFSPSVSETQTLRLLNKMKPKITNEELLHISRMILTSDFKKLIRGDKNQYYYGTTFQMKNRQNILLTSKINKNLAYLDDSTSTLVTISLITVLIILIIYILLYRIILSPFRKLKEKAALAGRVIPSGSYEVDSVINEYELIIKELKEKETELVELHKDATNRADSFEKFNQYLLGSIKAGIITIDKSGKIITINKSVEQMCQIQAVDFCGNDYLSLPFLKETIKNKINKTLNSEIHHPYEEYEFENPSIAVGLIISPVCDNDTHQIGASILINDISEIKKLHAELEKNRQMSALGEMSAGLAHQLRNSLGAILGYNQLVKKRLTQNNLETTSIDSMALELRESEDLIKRFLHFTKPFNYTPENEVISSIVEEIIKTLTLRADFQKITFRFENRFPLHKTISIDQLLFKQALTNIIENSKNAFLNQDGSITICLFEENNNCILTIMDNGCGISPENLGKIYTPFYSTNPSGTGLGLPLAQKIIALHTGILQVDSTLTKGTIFSIQLPLNLETKKETSEKKIAVS